LTLYKTFSAYDTDKSGELTIDEFEKIMKRLDSTFTHEEIVGVFDYLDTDKSKTIEFDELNSYYCKVNGIPESL
jgi:Ca2+-binding EF-hand superfamily protein